MVHKYAPILDAIMAGKIIQLAQENGGFKDVTEAYALWHLGAFDSMDKLRVKVDEVKIGASMVPKPMTEKPHYKQEYFFVHAGSTDSVSSNPWFDGVYCNKSLNSGLCWLKREDAVAAAAAISKLLKGV